MQFNIATADSASQFSFHIGTSFLRDRKKSALFPFLAITIFHFDLKYRIKCVMFDN